MFDLSHFQQHKTYCIQNHVLVQRIGHDASNWKMCINGVAVAIQVDANQLNTGDIGGLASVSSHLTLGSWSHGGSAADLFAGDMKQARIYRRVLGSDEISANFGNACTHAPVSMEHMEFWAPLNEGTTSVAPDDLINHRTGTHSGSGNAMSRAGLGSSQCSSSPCDHCITVEYLETAGAYRFGFNGKENDNELYDEGGWQDYGMRVYNPRIGRFPNVDPLAKKFPWFSPYQFAGNSPIAFYDLDGLENIYYSSLFWTEKVYKTALQLYIESGLFEKVQKYFATPDGLINNKYDMYVLIVTEKQFNLLLDGDDDGVGGFRKLYSNFKGDKKTIIDNALKQQSLNVSQTTEVGKEAIIIVIPSAGFDAAANLSNGMNMHDRIQLLVVSLHNLYHEQRGHSPHAYEYKLQLDPDPYGRNDHALIYGDDYEKKDYDRYGYSPSFYDVTSRISIMGQAKTDLVDAADRVEKTGKKLLKDRGTETH